MIEVAVFWTFASLVVLAALAVVLPGLGKSPIHGALALIGGFFCLAGLYVLLAAHLVATVQVIVYAGAIMVLFMFVIMLLNLSEAELGSPRYGGGKLLGGIALAIAFALIVRLIGEGETRTMAAIGGPESYGSLEPVGRLLLKTYMVPFEVVSILLLVAVIGAVVLAKRKVP